MRDLLFGPPYLPKMITYASTGIGLLVQAVMGG